MANHGGNLFADHVVGNSNSLLWIALIVTDDADNLLAIDAACSVDLVNCHAEASLELFAERSETAGDRASQA